MNLQLKPEVAAAVGAVRGAQVLTAMEKLSGDRTPDGWQCYSQLAGALCERPAADPKQDED